MANHLTRDDVDRIASLAHLELTDDEAELFTQQLADILSYAERLQEVDTSAIDTDWQMHGSLNRARSDSLKPSLSKSDVLSNAPDGEPDRNSEAGSFFRVPLVID